MTKSSFKRAPNYRSRIRDGGEGRGGSLSFTTSKLSKCQSASSSSQSSQGSQPPWKSERPFGKRFLNKEEHPSQRNLTSTESTFFEDCINALVKTCAFFVTKPFYERRDRKLSTRRKTAAFLENWKNLKNDSKILECVSGLKINFQEEPFQERVPIQAEISTKESKLINQEIKAMLTKGVFDLVYRKGS